jgi:hypothetical protein
VRTALGCGQDLRFPTRFWEWPKVFLISGAEPNKPSMVMLVVRIPVIRWRILR